MLNSQQEKVIQILEGRIEKISQFYPQHTCELNEEGFNVCPYFDKEQCVDVLKNVLREVKEVYAE